jgi:hypothetical protein
MSKKTKKEYSALAAARELEAQKNREEAQAVALARHKEEEQRAAYEKQLHDEHIELVRLKQGVIDESETLHEEQEEKKKYTIWQKISNFFYHNKWWMGIAAFFVATGGYLVYQTVTAVQPDMIVLLLVDDDYFYAACAPQIGELFEQYIEDENGDGKVVVDVYYIPASSATDDASGYTGDTEKLVTEFQTGEAVLVISDEEADQFIVPDSTLVDLEPYFGDYTQTEDMRFYLADTDFANEIGWTEEALDDDIYIGIRQVRKTLDSEEKMQQTYDISFPALEQFVAQFGTLKE